jgi:hypothetical protein
MPIPTTAHTILLTHFMLILSFKLDIKRPHTYYWVAPFFKKTLFHSASHTGHQHTSMHIIYCVLFGIDPRDEWDLIVLIQIIRLAVVIGIISQHFDSYHQC